MKNTSRGRRAALVLTAEENQWLEEMAGSAKAQRRHVRRAAVMLGFANGEAITALAGRSGLTRKSVGEWVDRALEVGVYAAIEDAPHGAAPKITEAAKTWALSLACLTDLPLLFERDFAGAAESIIEEKPGLSVVG